MKLKYLSNLKIPNLDLPNLGPLDKLASSRRGKVKLGLMALELALGGVIAYNVITAKPGSSLKPATITAPKNLPGATAVSSTPVNPPDKLVVTMTPGGGTYNQNVTIRFSSNVPCKIYWNAHGKDPRKYGEIYKGPFILASPDGKNTAYQMRFYGIHDYGIQTGIGAGDFLIKKERRYRTVVLITDNINNPTFDLNRLKEIQKRLAANGASSIAFPPGNNPSKILSRSDVPSGDKVLVVEIMGGADAAFIKERCSAWYKGILKGRKDTMIFCCGSATITGRAWLPRAHDDWYSGIAGISRPDLVLRNCGVEYIDGVGTYNYDGMANQILQWARY